MPTPFVEQLERQLARNLPAPRQLAGEGGRVREGGRRIAIAAALCVVAVGITGSAHPAAELARSLPGVVLWAWERPEDLRFLAGDSDVAVAFLAETIDLRGGRIDLVPRAQPLRTHPGTPLVGHPHRSAARPRDARSGDPRRHRSAIRPAGRVARGR